MNVVKEQSLNYDVFEDKKIVLIADEAHHLNASTKKKTKEEIENELSWEYTVDKILKINAENVLLEFTATCDLNDENIKKEYEDKIVFDYDLKKFRLDGYSKEISTMRTDYDQNDRMDRVLLALIFSQYRLKLFQDNKIDVKPCVLLKSDTIEHSNENIDAFINLINNLDGSQIENLLNSLNNKDIINVKNYILKNNISYDSLAREIQDGFGESHIISANDDSDIEEKQKILNSLEDNNNSYRAIFEVKKLDEGWDVLNLFDIVRMYETRQSGDKKLAPSTMSEAQLIGRGARYYPFKISEDDLLYQRKYDNDLENENRYLETLFYHCKNDSKYISEIHQALVQTGAIDDKKQHITYILKDSFKEDDFYKYGKIFMNDKIEISRNSINSLDSSIRNKEYQIKTDTGLLDVDLIMEDNVNIKVTELKEFKISVSDIAKINYSIIRRAINKYKALNFNNLKKLYPNLKSTKEFITNSNYMNDIKIVIYSQYDIPSLDILYKAVLKIAGKISDYVLGIEKSYKGTYTFNSKNISKVFTNKTIEITNIKEEGLGQPQKSSTLYSIDLSKKDWFVYEENYGTSEEKAFVKYFNDRVDEFKNKYEKIYLIRNERQMHLYSFDEGKRFEPDYVLFLIQKDNNIKSNTNSENERQPRFEKVGNAIKQFDQLQVFIEPKGNHLLLQDKWKEDFLLQLQDLNLKKIQISNVSYGDYGVWGLHFYNENRNIIEKDFDKDFDVILNSNNNQKPSNIIKKVLDKKLAAHVDVGKIANVLDDKED